MLTIYTDGSRITGSNKAGYAGIGIWFGNNDHRNCSIPILEVGATNQYAEIMAFYYGLQIVQYVDSVEICTDSQYTINCMTRWNSSWERNGWKTTKGKDVLYANIIKECTLLLRQRENQQKVTVITHVYGHTGIQGNDGADSLAREASLFAHNALINNVFYFSSGMLSNLYLSPFYAHSYSSDIVLFNCVEQYYQYQKAVAFRQYSTADSILSAQSPGYQKMKGQMISKFNQSVWDKQKVSIMENALILKFLQNDDARQYLIDTGGKHIAESVEDRVWGIGIKQRNAENNAPWRGQNLLGKALMNIRDIILESAYYKALHTQLKILTVGGDIFSASSDCVLVHACNTQGLWGAGIAFKFKLRYPSAYQHYREYCMSGKAVPGTSLLIPPLDGKNHWIGCLFTSRSYGKDVDSSSIILKNTKGAIEHLLREMSMHTEVPSYILMCKINSGKFNVPWQDTLAVLKSIRVYQNQLREITVCEF